MARRRKRHGAPERMVSEEFASDLAGQMASDAAEEQAERDAGRINDLYTRQEGSTGVPEPGSEEENGSNENDHSVSNNTMGAMGAQNSALNPGRHITEEVIAEAQSRCDTYYQGMTNLFQRLRMNEEYYKLRYTNYRMDTERPTLPTQASGYLLNAIQNKVADTMDNYPEPNILAREQSDEVSAAILSKVVTVAIERNDFKRTYYEEALQKVKNGFSISGVFWNPVKDNIGEVEIRMIDPLRMRWEPGIENIQDSKEVFLLTDIDNDTLISMYPDLAGKLVGNDGKLDEYLHEDYVDKKNKSTVYDWYYKTTKGVEVAGQIFPRTVLQYVKFCAGIVLYASEDDPAMQEGWYMDGEYPFVFDVLFPLKETPTGFGYIDIMRNPQEYIDKMDFAVLQNALSGARPRYMIKDSSGVNEDEFADFTKLLVHYNGSRDDLLPMSTPVLQGNMLTYLHDKKEELKENAGNRDFSQGTTSGGVTAASAIAALQEASSKTSRLMNSLSYESYKKIIRMVIYRMQQFYTVDRTYRIVDANGATQYVSIGMSELRPGAAIDETLGTVMGGRLPIYDIDIQAEKASPYSRLAQNELALQLYNAGFFNPELGDQAITALMLMDFDGKDKIIRAISQNRQLFIENQQMKQVLAGLGPMITQLTGNSQIEQMFSGSEANRQQGSIQNRGAATVSNMETDQLGDTTVYKDNSLESQMRKKTREQTKVQ